MITGPTVTLTGSAQSVAMPAPLPTGELRQVRFDNESVYALRISFLGYGEDLWMGAWTADRRSLPGACQGFTVTPTQLETPIPATISQSLLISVGENPEEEIPGVYPMALARQVALGSVPGSGGIGSIVGQTIQRRPYDWFTHVVGGAGATVQLFPPAGPAGLVTVIDYVMWSIFQEGGGGAIAGAVNARILDLAGPPGHEFFKQPLAVAASINALDRISLVGLGLPSPSPISALGWQIDFDSGFANVAEYISAGGFYE